MKLTYKAASDGYFYSSLEDIETFIYTRLIFKAIKIHDIYLTEDLFALNILKKNKGILSYLQNEINLDSDLIFLLINNFTLNKRFKTHKYFDLMSKIFFNYNTKKISKYYNPNTKFINDEYTLEYFTIVISNVPKEKMTELQYDQIKCVDFTIKIKELFRFDRFEFDYIFYNKDHEGYEVLFSPNLNIKFDELSNSIYIYFGVKVTIDSTPISLDDPYNMKRDFLNKLKEIKNVTTLDENDLVKCEVLNKITYPKINYNKFKKNIKNNLKVYNRYQKILNKK